MNRSTFSLEVFGDRISSEIYKSKGDNKAYIDHLKRLLKSAVKEELTARQREAVIGFYYDGKSITELAAVLGVNKSTVSRNLSRAKEKLAAALKYGLAPIYLEDT